MHPYRAKRTYDTDPVIKVARNTMVREAIEDSMDLGAYEDVEYSMSYEMDVYCEFCGGPCSGLAIPFEGFEQ